MEGIFTRIVSDEDAFFQHQQKGEEDLTTEKKLEILKNLVSEKLSIFVTRYQKYLMPEDCEIFAENEDFVVQSIMQQVRKRKDITEKEKRNLRFNTMQRLIKEGVYFSDCKMREREPYLFDAMIGKFLNDDERMDHLRPTVSRDKSESTWSTLLDRLEDSSEVTERRKVQEKEWEGERMDDGGRDHITRFMSHVASRTDDFVPEEEEDGSGNDDKKEQEQDEIEVMRKEMERLSKIEAEQYDQLDEDDTKEVLRQEFEAFMQQKFLAGKDKEFYDYSKCEEHGLSDPVKERDDEERWFDEDD
ncbi:hypothetical protein CAEBREN_30854 [Caenorhabditis brenneri]|uniref:CCD97-like C-terminal domain-containing protein n=1 Tax=Caenorhabditis brenneri TaxID=135651 RepID=G0PEC5_CAEBE|nr:hypothetical protein CAEBREN_30854 [Caenorhabditis brenneri]